MDSRTKKNMQQFKKQIKKEQIQKKKAELRRGLPYYDQMFRRSEEESCGTNSRSSRFPVPLSSKSNNETQKNQLCLQAYQRERQLKYLDYLKNLKNETLAQRKQMIQAQMTQKYGKDCFESTSDLFDMVYIDLANYQNHLLRNEPIELQWTFVLACFYLAQNQILPQIQRICNFLISTHFMPWYQDFVLRMIAKKMPIQSFSQTFLQAQQWRQKIQETILSRFLILKEQNQLDEQEINHMLGYFGQKLEMLDEMEKLLLKIYSTEEFQFYSEIVYDYGSVCLIEGLAQILKSKETSLQFKIEVYHLMNKYYVGYPQNVQNKCQIVVSFDKIILSYLNNFNYFMEFFKKRITTDYLAGQAYKLISYVPKLIRKIYYDESEQLILFSVKSILSIIQSSVQIVFQMKTLFQEIPKFIQLHEDLLQLFIMLLKCLKQPQQLIGQQIFINYLNLLLTEWQAKKLTIRNQFQTLVYFQPQKMQHCQIFEFYLIHILQFVRKSTSDMQLSQLDEQYLQNMYKYADFVYSKEKELILSMNKSNLYQSLQYFLFPKNIDLYLKLSKDCHEEVDNPENSSNQTAYQQDIEI